MNLINFLLTRVSFRIDPRLDFWKTGYIIFFGVEAHCGGEYRNLRGDLQIDMTILGVGFKIRFEKYPKVNKYGVYPKTVFLYGASALVPYASPGSAYTL